MKHALIPLLVILYAFAIPQGAMAAFVFNPTLTMKSYRPPPSPKARKLTEVRQNAGGGGAAKVETEGVVFPMFGMNKRDFHTP